MITDEPAFSIVSDVVCYRAPKAKLMMLPKTDTGDFIRNCIKTFAPTHLISLERPGKAANGHYHSMRGEVLDDMITDSALFLSEAKKSGATTISIGDGGNEIGMGHIESYAIEDIVDHGDEIACTVPTQELIVAGCSNWGGHAFVCSLYAMGHREVAGLLDEQWHRGVLANITAAGGLDGVKLVNIPTVDGLSERQYYSQINALSQLAR